MDKRQQDFLPPRQSPSSSDRTSYDPTHQDEERLIRRQEEGPERNRDEDEDQGASTKDKPFGGKNELNRDSFDHQVIPRVELLDSRSQDLHH